VAVNKDYEGNPINVFVQMDVDEYFNILCEKLDNLLKGTPQAALLHNIWCGKLSSQLICKGDIIASTLAFNSHVCIIGCPHRYERADPFYTISLDIKNKSNILEALELYVKGEMLEGDNAYNCEKCGTKRDALKRTCIKTLPNTLILHLKRFEFDFDSMRKVKLVSFMRWRLQIY
jgi:ubiquitin C-terminal hydrolase